MTAQPHPPGLSDERVEGIIGNLLRIGVLLSATVVSIGGVLYLIHDGRLPRPNLQSFPMQTNEPPSLLRIVQESAQGNSQSFILLGLLLLIATPVARVIFSIAAFALQRDYLYVAFTLIVLTVLLYSLFYGYFSGSGAL
jgi:uncharacterized membrane protein